MDERKIFDEAEKELDLVKTRKVAAEAMKKLWWSKWIARNVTMEIVDVVWKNVMLHQRARSIVKDMLELAMIKGETFTMNRMGMEIRRMEIRQMEQDRESRTLVEECIRAERIAKAKERRNAWWRSRKVIKTDTDPMIKHRQEEKNKDQDLIMIREGHNPPEGRNWNQVKNLSGKRKRSGKPKYH